MSKRVMVAVAAALGAGGLALAAPGAQATHNCTGGYDGGSAPVYAGADGMGAAGGASTPAGWVQGSDTGSGGCLEGSTSDGTVHGSGTRSGTDTDGSVTVAGNTVTLP